MDTLKITQHMKREAYCKEKFPELYERILLCCGNSYLEKLYNYCNPGTTHNCWCGNPTKFVNFNKGYARYCSPGCTSKDPRVKQQKEHTVMTHYGVSNPSRSKDVRLKVRQTMLDRYGDEHYNNREQAQQTCLERYGVTNVMLIDEIKEKLKRTCQRRYGVEYVLANPDIIEKATQTLIERYGGRGNASEELFEKTLQTCLELYGDEHYNNREQAQQTCLELYGDEHYNNREQAQQTCLERYGDEHYTNREQAQQTCLERYGVKYIPQTSEVREKIKQTCLDRYGVENVMASQESKDKLKQTCLGRYGVEYASQSQVVKDKVRTTLNAKLAENFPDLISCFYQDGVKYYKMGCGSCTKCNLGSFDIRAIDASRRKSYGLEICPVANPFAPVSNTSIEKFVKSILDGCKIEYIENDRTVLNGKELDIYIPTKHIAIECNGTYWHSSKFHSNSYHFDKYVECQNKGVQLLTIWSDQIASCPEKVKNIVLSKLGVYSVRIPARKCVVKPISSKLCKSFIDEVHLQNDVNASHRIGLYYNDDLVSVMTFGKSRNCMSQKQSWELYRYAVKPGYQIIGGASKLFAYFLKECHPEMVISFSSNDISNGSLYQRLGFQKESQTIGYWYVKNNIRYHRYTFSKHKLVGMGYDKSKSEFEIMSELGYDRIYDSSQTKWVYYINTSNQ